MKIAIGSDHAGFEMKVFISKFLIKMGHELTDRGAFGPESVDYSDYAHIVSNDILENRADFGILICGSGNGICMSANKHQGIRAALCWTPELGSLARQHNDANVVCLPARFISKRMAKNIVKNFLESNFEGGRHQKRVDKISC